MGQGPFHAPAIGVKACIRPFVFFLHAKIVFTNNTICQHTVRKYTGTHLIHTRQNTRAIHGLGGPICPICRQPQPKLSPMVRTPCYTLCGSLCQPRFDVPRSVEGCDQPETPHDANMGRQCRTLIGTIYGNEAVPHARVMLKQSLEAQLLLVVACSREVEVAIIGAISPACSWLGAVVSPPPPSSAAFSVRQDAGSKAVRGWALFVSHPRTRFGVSEGAHADKVTECRDRVLSERQECTKCGCVQAGLRDFLGRTDVEFLINISDEDIRRGAEKIRSRFGPV